MSARRIAAFMALAVIFAIATWLGGWWTVPLAGAVAGFLRARPMRIATAASLAWLALLGVDAVAGEGFGRLAGLLAGVMGFPAIVLVVVTGVFPGVLAWSAAMIGEVIAGPGVTGEPPETPISELRPSSTQHSLEPPGSRSTTPQDRW